jgi:hypothetical protein
MSTRWKAESVLEDLKKGRMDEYDARRELRRIYGSCSSMNESIRRSVRHTSYGYDTFSESHRLEDAKRNCDNEE